MEDIVLPDVPDDPSSDETKNSSKNSSGNSSGNSSKNSSGNYSGGSSGGSDQKDTVDSKHDGINGKPETSSREGNLLFS